MRKETNGPCSVVLFLRSNYCNSLTSLMFPSSLWFVGRISGKFRLRFFESFKADGVNLFLGFGLK